MIQKTSDINTQQTALRQLVVRGNELLCLEGKVGLGYWGDIRSSCTSLWSLCDCGLGERHPHFIHYCLKKIRATRDAILEDDLLCFNNEVWDTALALIAFSKSRKEEWAGDIVRIVDWLQEEAQDDNWYMEPWETLFAITALLTTGKDMEKFTPLIKRSLKWVLEQRNVHGVLISVHYMAFLLSVLNEVLIRLKLTPREKSLYLAAIDSSLAYLKEDYRKNRRRGSLWGDEPWIIGHVLLGIASAPDKSQFVLDTEFNDYLVRWYQNQEWLPGRGWGDLTNTSFNLVGLTNYYIEREASLKSDLSRIGIRKNLASEISFHFNVAEMPIDMTLRPRWKGRDFKVKPDNAFIVMPYGEAWSDEVHSLIRTILLGKRYKTVRGDDMRTPDIMEDIWRGINEARLIIADCTNMNPNVLYELGMAHTIGKNVILLTQNIRAIAFDVLGLRYITYTYDKKGFNKLRTELPRTIDEVLKT